MATLRSNYTQEAANGAYSTSLSTPFKIPVLGGSDAQEFNDISWVSMGQPVYFADEAGTTWGFFKVVGIDVDNKKLALQNKWNEIGGGTTIPVVQVALETLDDITLGTAAALDVGTGANNVVQLDGSGNLPAVNGSALTGVAIVVSPPATASSTGTAGQIAYDASYIYICTATNTWLRAPIATW